MFTALLCGSSLINLDGETNSRLPNTSFAREVTKFTAKKARTLINLTRCSLRVIRNLEMHDL